MVSPDGRLVMALGPDRQPALYPIAGGDPQPIRALGSDLTPIGWSDTARIIFARSRVLGRSSSVFKVDLATGSRQPWKALGPGDPSGAPLVMNVQVSPDGERYAYMTSPMLSDLFLISGVFGPAPESR
jgi:hypothetical protein